MKKIIFIIIIILVCIFLYGKFISINTFKVNEYEIDGKNVPTTIRDLTIIHFSDTLISGNDDVDKLSEIVEKINSYSPDIVFFTGDLIDDEYKINSENKNKLINYLKEIETSLYKYAVIGDNDEKELDSYKTILDNSNFILLDNKTVPLFYKDNTPITITGISNLEDISLAYQTDDSINSDYNITLVHKPDNVDKLMAYGDLFLSGHSLGGYINAPFIGPIIKKDNAKIYSDGYYNIDDKEIIVSNGLGTENFSFRLFNTPSINVYTFLNN